MGGDEWSEGMVHYPCSGFRVLEEGVGRRGTFGGLAQFGVVKGVVSRV
jgi:hypothetical protein